MTDRIKCSPIPVRTEAQRIAARQTPHKFISLADTIIGLSGVALGRAIDICYRCGENRLKEDSQHYTTQDIIRERATQLSSPVS